MKIINFNVEFAARIEKGIKTSTMRGYRADGKIPYRKGEWVQFYTGMRTPAAQCFGYARIEAVIEIMLTMRKGNEFADMTISDADGMLCKDGKQTIPFTMQELRRMEGFDDDIEMFAWFWESKKTTKCAPHFDKEVREFRGYFIKWDLFVPPQDADLIPAPDDPDRGLAWQGGRKRRLVPGCPL